MSLELLAIAVSGFLLTASGLVLLAAGGRLLRQLRRDLDRTSRARRSAFFANLEADLGPDAAQALRAYAARTQAR